MARVFQHVAGAHPRYSAFDLSHSKQFNCDMGQLIPILFEECIPGDRFSLGASFVLRMEAMVKPIMHSIKIKADYFFISSRHIMNEKTMRDLGDVGTWEQFMTGGQEGPQADGSDEIPLPLWNNPSGGFKKYSMADYFGLPLGVNIPNDLKPISFPKRCMNLVWNEHYRDQDLQDEVSLDSDELLYRNWSKDYFTISRPWQLRGDPPALPLTGLGHAIWNYDNFDTAIGRTTVAGGGVDGALLTVYRDPNSPTVGAYGGYKIGTWSPVVNDEYYNVSAVASGMSPMFDTAMRQQPNNQITDRMKIASVFGNNSIDMSGAGTFNVSDIRLAFRLQEWMERNARGGARYTEFLVHQYGVRARDYRLQRPEYIGGLRENVVVSEVLQTSETSSNSQQGNVSGHGISASQTNVGKYYVPEHGYILGIMSIVPEPVYYQGVPKQLLRRTRYDFPNDLFTHLSEQPILNGELCVTGNELYDKGFFGYQGIYDEMRQHNNMVCADMRDVQDYWNLARQFDRNSPPKLNAEFVSTKGTIRKDIFIVNDEPGFVVNWGNNIRAVRPLPIIATPRT